MTIKEVLDKEFFELYCTLAELSNPRMNDIHEKIDELTKQIVDRTIPDITREMDLNPGKINQLCITLKQEMARFKQRVIVTAVSENAQTIAHFSAIKDKLSNKLVDGKVNEKEIKETIENMFYGCLDPVKEILAETEILDGCQAELNSEKSDQNKMDNNVPIRLKLKPEVNLTAKQMLHENQLMDNVNLEEQLVDGIKKVLIKFENYNESINNYHIKRIDNIVMNITNSLCIGLNKSQQGKNEIYAELADNFK